MLRKAYLKERRVIEVKKKEPRFSEEGDDREKRKDQKGLPDGKRKYHAGDGHLQDGEVIVPGDHRGEKNQKEEVYSCLLQLAVSDNAMVRKADLMEVKRDRCEE